MASKPQRMKASSLSGALVTASRWTTGKSVTLPNRPEMDHPSLYLDKQYTSQWSVCEQISKTVQSPPRRPVTDTTQAISS